MADLTSMPLRLPIEVNDGTCLEKSARLMPFVTGVPAIDLVMPDNVCCATDVAQLKAALNSLPAVLNAVPSDPPGAPGTPLSA